MNGTSIIAQISMSLNISADAKIRCIVADFSDKTKGIQSCYIHIYKIMTSLFCLAEMLSVTLNGSLTFKTSTLQMQALIKSCNMPQTGLKLNEK